MRTQGFTKCRKVWLCVCENIFTILWALPLNLSIWWLFGFLNFMSSSFCPLKFDDLERNHQTAGNTLPKKLSELGLFTSYCNKVEVKKSIICGKHQPVLGSECSNVAHYKWLWVSSCTKYDLERVATKVCDLALNTSNWTFQVARCKSNIFRLFAACHKELFRDGSKWLAVSRGNIRNYYDHSKL